FCSMAPSFYSSHSPSFSNFKATPEFSSLSLHDALPISVQVAGQDLQRRHQRRHPHRHREHGARGGLRGRQRRILARQRGRARIRDRKSTRLNSSHVKISYAVFCLKKKRNEKNYWTKDRV